MNGTEAQSFDGDGASPMTSKAYIELRNHLALLIEESISNDVTNPLAENEAVANILNRLPQSRKEVATTELIKYFKQLVVEPRQATANLEKFARIHFFCGIEDAWVDQMFITFLYRANELLVEFRNIAESEVLLREITAQVIEAMKLHSEITASLMDETLSKFQTVLDVKDDQPSFNEYIDAIRDTFLEIDGIDLCAFKSLIDVYPYEERSSQRLEVVLDYVGSFEDQDKIRCEDIQSPISDTLHGSIAVVPLNTIDHGPVTLILTSPYVGFFGRVIEEVHIRSFVTTFERKNDRRIAILTLEEERKRAKLADRTLQILRESIELTSIAGPIEGHFKDLTKSILKIANISSVFILAISYDKNEIEVLASAGLGMKSIKQIFTTEYTDDLYSILRGERARIIDDVPDGALREIFGPVATQFKWQSVIGTPFVATDYESVMLFAASSDSTATSDTVASLLE